MFMKVMYASILIVIMLSIGTTYYSVVEGWSYVDAFYFSTMTLTTIGFGDFVPTHDASKIFTSFYAIFGIGIMVYILSSVVGGFIFSQERYFDKIFAPHRLKNDENVLKHQEKELKHQEKELKELEKKVRKKD